MKVEFDAKGLKVKLDKMVNEDKIKSALLQGALAIEKDAKLNCPVDTGNLRRSIETSVEDGGMTVRVGTPVEYAPYVEYGHRQEVGRFVPQIGKRLVNEYVPAQPFLAPAFEKNRDQIINNIAKAVGG